MMVDEDWSTREERAFQWWGHGHAQRAWVELPRDDNGTPVSLVHVETDFLRNVADTEKTCEELDRLQMIATQSAFIYLPREGKIRMHSTAYIHEGNHAWLSRVLLNAAGVQLLLTMGVGGFQQFFEGSVPDTTPHPLNGYRENADELIGGLRDFYASAQESPVQFPGNGFE